MQYENNLNPADRELEEALARLSPAKSSISRDELLFRAGRRSITPHLWVWRGATLAAAAAVALVFFLRPSLNPTERIVYVDRVVEHRELISVAASPAGTASDQPAPRLDPKEFRIRQMIIRLGADALPYQASATPVKESLERAIGIPRSDLGVGEVLLRQFGQKGGL